MTDLLVKVVKALIQNSPLSVAELKPELTKANKKKTSKVGSDQ